MTARLTAEQEAALRAAEKAATPGQWVCEEQYYDGLRYAIEIGAPDPAPHEPDDQILIARCMNACGLHRKLYRREDAAFVAMARNAMPSLLAELEAARAEHDCGQDVVCSKPPGCARHWEERNRELVAELDVVRAEKATAGAALATLIAMLREAAAAESPRDMRDYILAAIASVTGAYSARVVG
jgi:hypothetical protein